MHRVLGLGVYIYKVLGLRAPCSVGARWCVGLVDTCIDLSHV